MAYKMKGFPLRSGFKHPVNIEGHGHVDAGKGAEGSTDTEIKGEARTLDPNKEIIAANQQLAALRPLYHDQDSKHYKSSNMATQIQAMKDILLKYDGEDETIEDYK